MLGGFEAVSAVVTTTTGYPDGLGVRNVRQCELRQSQSSTLHQGMGGEGACELGLNSA
jgi:hypothetical protein